MQIDSFEVTISNISSLLVNRFHEAAQAEATSGVHSRARDPQTPEEDAESRLYVLPDGQTYFPAENLRQSCITAAGRHKIGRRSASTDAAAALSIEPDAMPLIGEWHTDSRAVVIPATKGRLLRHRPMFDKWTISFNMLIVSSMFDVNLARRVLDDAGLYVGIGDFRPQKKGPFGRFQVDNWTKVS
jgi:hypothetical protein